jgi:radical SAM superfamily enzyme YgiQ (UPF0313 family)
MHAARVLLVNPWIHDFAAYDFWARPLGLLTVGGWLRAAGVEPALLDLTDPRSPHLPSAWRPRRKPGGHGRFVAQQIPRPAALPYVNRKWRRYGLPPEFAEAVLSAMPRPDAALVTSMMTYWSDGVAATIAALRRRWPDVTVALGGVYAALCPDHARAHSGADEVLAGPIEEAGVRLANLLEVEPPAIDPSRPPSPAWDLAPHADSAALLTSRGCPRRCPYCGVRALSAQHVPFAVETVTRDAALLVERLGIADLALFDDAFLLDEDRAVEILQRLAALGRPVRLHAASGLSCRGLTARAAAAMKRAGFMTIRLGLETSDPQRQRDLGGKVTNDEFRSAVENLLSAGFAREALGAYALVGLPGQGPAEVEATVEFVLRQGLQPHLAEYAPTPGSPLFPAARAASRFDLDEPLFHNPTLASCTAPALAAALPEIKRRIVAATRARG